MIPERYGGLPLATPGLVRAARELGLEVHVWTVNEAADMRRLIELGVVTNSPDRLIKLIDRSPGAAQRNPGTG